MLFATPTALLAAASLLSSILPTFAHAAWPRRVSEYNTNGGRRSDDDPKAILLSRVGTLTLRGHGALTSNRRVPAIPQLRCISHPEICRLADESLDVMRCTNQGSSYADADVEWSCSATLPDELRLGSTDVICEGYSSPDDPYILKGSCGVEYRLALTAKGEERYPDLLSSGFQDRLLANTDVSGRLFMVLFIGVFLWIVYSAYTQWNANNAGAPRRPARRRNNGRRGGGGGDDYGPGGGGSGWDPRYGSFNNDDDDPPPPYPGRKSQAGSSQRRQQQQEGWRPGFWTGLAAGGAAAYYAGSGRNRDRDDNVGTRRRAGGPSFSSSQAGPSGSSHESTGFGSTSRR